MRGIYNKKSVLDNSYVHMEELSVAMEPMNTSDRYVSKMSLIMSSE